MNIRGVWLPIVTPFVDNYVDFHSYENLLNYYKNKGITGVMPVGTTGESPSITAYEYEKIIETTMRVIDGDIPVFIGLGGNVTDNIIDKLKVVEKYKVDGVLSVCPYYNRPSAEGLYQHFKKISESTELKIVIYNIPYRTGINMSNETLFRLAEFENVVGVKDSSGDLKQSLELISNKPEGFSVLTGEDIMFYTNVSYGGDGGILASSHLNTEEYVEIFNLLQNNDHHTAIKKWRGLEGTANLLFEEPNPGPVKYCLEQMNLIQSSKLRLPMTGISAELKNKLLKYAKVA